MASQFCWQARTIIELFRGASIKLASSTDFIEDAIVSEETTAAWGQVELGTLAREQAPFSDIVFSSSKKQKMSREELLGAVLLATSRVKDWEAKKNRKKFCFHFTRPAAIFCDHCSVKARSKFRYQQARKDLTRSLKALRAAS